MCGLEITEDFENAGHFAVVGLLVSWSLSLSLSLFFLFFFFLPYKSISFFSLFYFFFNSKITHMYVLSLCVRLCACHFTYVHAPITYIHYSLLHLSYFHKTQNSLTPISQNTQRDRNAQGVPYPYVLFLLLLRTHWLYKSVHLHYLS